MAPRPRLELQELLQALVPVGWKVYHQEPGSLQMSYPCILYKRSDLQIEHADNAPYNSWKRYSITVIDRDPDSSIPAKIAALPTASFVQHYVADNLNHDVYSIFF